MPENVNHSPRISFSHDFCNTDSIPMEQWRSPSKSFNHDFDFSIPDGGISAESSWSAEEFFNDGKILPTEIKKQPETRNCIPVQKKLEENKTGLPNPEINLIGEIKPVLEIEEIGGKEDEVKLPLLRNYSKDSNSKQKQNVKLEVLSSSLNDSFQKPPLKKNHGGYRYRGNGGMIRVSSLLDVVPSGNYFGLGTINFGGKRNKTKWRSLFFCW